MKILSRDFSRAERLLLVFLAVVLICLVSVPQLAAWVVASAGASEVSGNVMSAAKKAASIAVKKH